MISLKYKRKTFLVLSLILFLINLSFVYINYVSSRTTLENTLLQRAKTHQNEVDLAFKMTYRNMIQLSTFISKDAELNQLFLAGKNATEKEVGHSNREESQKIRNTLLNRIKPQWDLMAEKFNIRQLHYHFGPGSLSFLRVHKPSKFGDRMDDLRFIVVDTNSEKKPHIGFETGRVNSGLRGVSPVWAIDPISQVNTYVGAVEVGTSFQQMLTLFSDSFETESAVLLSKEHVMNKMLPEVIEPYFQKNPDEKYYLEASTSNSVKNILDKTDINEHFSTDKTSTLEINDQYYSVYYFPIFDYQNTKEKTGAPSGFVLIWEDVSSLFSAFNYSIMINFMFLIVAFTAIEVSLLFILNREEKLFISEKESKIDKLTNLYNRRYYDIAISKLTDMSKRTNTPLSLIMLDIDFFKNYNDTYGHATGDTGLQKVAKLLKKTALRKTDIVARYGGEEFVVILPNTPLNIAVNIAEQIRIGILSLKIPNKGSPVNPYLTVSLGVACTQNLPKESILFEAVDANLYKAKRTGRNKVEPSPNDTK